MLEGIYVSCRPPRITMQEPDRIGNGVDVFAIQSALSQRRKAHGNKRGAWHVTSLHFPLSRVTSPDRYLGLQ